jgi:hypothetical protein
MGNNARIKGSKAKLKRRRKYYGKVSNVRALAKAKYGGFLKSKKLTNVGAAL